jgi:hypothetical protein
MKQPTSLASGLTNLGNTCYMNSVLQALFATDSIRNYVIRNQRTTLMIVLGRLFEDMKSQDSSYCNPSLFRSQFIKFQPKFRGYEWVFHFLVSHAKRVYNSTRVFFISWVTCSICVFLQLSPKYSYSPQALFVSFHCLVDVVTSLEESPSMAHAMLIPLDDMT